MRIKFAFAFFFLGISTYISTAQDEGKIISHYLFPAFTPGSIKFKTGIVKMSNLNYNSVTEEMIFEANGKKLALANPEAIDTISIDGRLFVPAGKIFYEILENLPVPLLLHHLCTVTPPGKPSGYGGTSETSSITSTSTIYSSRGIYEMKLPDDFKVQPYSEFLLKKDNVYYRALNVSQVIKCFPEKKDAIKEFVKTNKTNFKKTDDVKSLVVFCNR